MKIVQVSAHESRRYIPVKGWESVDKVLNIYANGFTRGAKATEQVTVNDLEKGYGSSGGMAAGLFLLGNAMFDNRSLLVDNLLKEAKERLKTQTKFRKSWDYDGMGTPFFKASVDIDVLDRKQDMYTIGIYAAYVGDEPEAGLAEHFGIPRTLLSCSVEVETKPLSGNRFEFDFEPVLRKLDMVLDTKKITGKQVVAAMTTKDYDKDTSFVLQVKDDLEVYIRPGRVEHRMKYVEGEPHDTWSSKGSMLSGELAHDYNSKDKNAKAMPTFFIGIHSSQKERWVGSLPIWQPDLQKKAIDIAHKITAILR